jgi:hypothetical protein
LPALSRSGIDLAEQLVELLATGAEDRAVELDDERPVLVEPRPARLDQVPVRL